MIKEMPLTFWMLKSKVVSYDLFYVCNDREQFQRKEGSFIDFHAILK